MTLQRVPELYVSPNLYQYRLWAKSILIYRPGVSDADMEWARCAVGWAWWHGFYDVLTLSNWRGVSPVVREEVENLGLNLVLFKTIAQARNCADWICGETKARKKPVRDIYILPEHRRNLN